MIRNTVNIGWQAFETSNLKLAAALIAKGGLLKKDKPFSHVYNNRHLWAPGKTGLVTWYFEVLTKDGIKIADLARAWEEGNADVERDKVIGDIPEPHRSRLLAVIDKADMAWMRGGMINREGLLDIVRKGEAKAQIEKDGISIIVPHGDGPNKMKQKYGIR